VQEQRLREQGVVREDDENAPIELDEDAQRLVGSYVRKSSGARHAWRFRKL
jgi:hypothetical protein